MDEVKARFHMIAGKKPSAIVAIMWKKKRLFSDLNDHSNHMETSLYGNCSAIKVATTAQLSGSDHVETSLKQ